MMQSSPSQLLQALLKSLSLAEQSDPNKALPLDETTLAGTSGASLLKLFTQQLGIPSFTLATNVQLPASVTDDTLTISGEGQGLSLTLNFQDVSGEIAIQALFQAPATATLPTQFPSLPPTFYQRIDTSQKEPTVTVPGLGSKLSFDSPVFGLVGHVVPSIGLIAYSIAPQIQGQVTVTSGVKGLQVVLPTDTSGWQISPLSGSVWELSDLGWFLPNLAILGAFPSIISTQNLGLSNFSLTLFEQAPSLSSLVLDVADIQDPTKPLWSAAGGKIELVDVVVTLALNYDQNLTIGLAGNGWVEGDFQLGSLVLQVQIPFPLEGIWSISAYPNLELPDLGDIASLLSGGSSSMKGLMPPGLADLGGFTFTYLRVAVNITDFSLTEFTFALGSTNPWPLIPDGVLTLDKLQIQMTIDSTPSIVGSVNGHFVMGANADVFVNFGRISASLPWSISVISPAIALPNISEVGSLVQSADLSSQIQAAGLNQLHLLITNLNLGLTISPTKLTNLGMTLSLANASQPTEQSLDWEVIPGTLTVTNFSVAFQLTWNPNLSIDVSGLFTVNGLNFEIKFGKGANGDAFIAAYSPATAGAGTIDVKQLINQISPTVAQALPEGLDIDLADAMVAYINTNGVKKFLFAMDISVEFPLSDIPLVGKDFASGAQAGVKNLKIVVTSAAMSAADVTLINELITELHGSVNTLPSPPANQTGDVIPSGFSMVAELALGDETILITSPAPGPPPPESVARTAMTPNTALALNDGAAGNNVMWINVQKTFGPVSIQKVGFSYQSGALFILTNMSLAAGGLEIDLLGLGIGSPISNPSVEFTIQGIAVGFQEGPVSIQGGMMGKLSPVSFVGALSVQMTEFTLAAFAGYAEEDGNQPSFFLYGILNAPIGGPPPFFVTGIAAGFGFNRKLLIPDVSQVANFPLVQWAIGTNSPPPMNPGQSIGDQVGAVLTRLSNQGIVPPSIGDYWFAAGLSFTSFELVSSFALLILEVGTHVEIALLGISTLQIPPDEPVAEVQIALEVTFSPDSGLLAIAGQLTNNSYILSRDCHLTGGFAFYLWFGSEHTGETVLTFGGYNPNFTVPDYYPQVPRLGMNWQVTSELSIQGDLYFALTSSAVMAGGMMSAVWESGPISAWYTVWADFLMVFSPFHYYLDGGIDLGASFTINLLFVSISITIHLGVDIEIWGPEFAGRATIDLSIISFTISFGASGQSTSTQIPWSDFVKQLLPSQSQPKKQLRLNRRAANLADASPAPAAVQIVITQGLIKTLDNTPSNPQYLVNSETFLCSVLTIIPIKPPDDPTKSFTGNVSLSPNQPTDGQGVEIKPNVNFGAGPAGIQPLDFQPALTVNVATNPESPAADSNFDAVRRFSNSPKALWENKTFDPSTGVPQTDPNTALSETTLPNTLQGYDLVPTVAPPDHTLPIPLETLLFTLDDHIQPFAWSTPAIATSDSFSTQTVATTINTATVTGVRSQLLNAIHQQGISLDTQINVGSLADPANNDLLAAPPLRLLGEQKAAA